MIHLSLIVKLVPRWSPSNGSTLTLANGSSKSQNYAPSKATGEYDFSKFQAYEGCLRSNISTEVNMTVVSGGSTDKPVASSDYILELNTFDLGSDCMIHPGLVSKHDKSTKDLLSALDLVKGDERQEEEEEELLKLELDAIDMQYNQCFRELTRLREEAIENAKKEVDNEEGSCYVIFSGDSP
ncbi:hypothetical protein M5689_008431 [Euphorbia peplus]|nr:hypothetical protein M5689_008431 [Euphorbia peplus]